MTPTPSATAPHPGVSHRPPALAPRGERGSAFTVALLVLVVLTIGGLILTLISQTEMRIGTNERTSNRTLYAADSGIQVATGQNLWKGAGPGVTFYLNTTNQDTGLTPQTTFSDQVTVTPLVNLAFQDAALTGLDQNGGTYGLYKAWYVVNSTSTRVGANSTTSQSETFANKTLTATIEVNLTDQINTLNTNLGDYNAGTTKLLF